MKEEIELKSGSSSKSTPLAIVGISCIFPEADNLRKYWTNIKNRVDAITDIPDTHWNIEDFYNDDPKVRDMTYAKRGGFISPVDFNPLEFAIAPNTIEATDTSQILGLVAAKNALEDAGYWEDKEFDRLKTSVILGVTGTLELVVPLGARLGHPIWRKALKECGADDEFAGEVVSRISDSYVDWQETSFPGLLGNVVAGKIANVLDMGGTNCVVDAACGSSFSALNLAALELETGRSDMVLAGGVDTFNDIFMYMCFSKTPALSPTGNARPFDHKCDGTMIGEGLGMIVLKRLEDAQRDGDNIYAVIKSVGTSSDGKGAAVFAPQAKGQKRALRKAYELADVSPATIELIEAHGTGTKVGENTEVSALTEIYREADSRNRWCAVGSVKSQIGHTKAAAGIAGLIKTVMALKHKVLPPTIKVEKPLEVLDTDNTPFYVNTIKRPWMPSRQHPRRAAVSSFGFGGSNYHCVLEEFVAEKTEIDWDDTVQILAFSSDNIEEVKKQLGSWTIPEPWPAFCLEAEKTRNLFNINHQYRLLIPVEKGVSDIRKTISGAESMLEKKGVAGSWTTPDGVCFGVGKPGGKLGVVFPGQGAQYTGMLRDLVCQFPHAFDVVTEANGAYESNKPGDIEMRLIDYIYPHPAFDDETKTKQEQALTDTRVAQPALGAVCIGALKVLGYFGMKPDAYAGHSYGELAALCSAGRMSGEELHYLSALRGKLMAGAGGDLGSMLAVQADLETVEKAVKENNIDLVIANKNAPNQAVLSGRTDEINRAYEILSGIGLRSTKIPVAAAFHSPIIADAQKPFGEALKNVSFNKSLVPVFSNTTGETYPEEPETARELLAGQLAKPVEFVNEIRKMYEYGIRTFVEVGPGARMAGLIKSILEKTGDFTVISIDSSKGKKNGILDFAKTLSQLASLGYATNLVLWNPVPEDVKAELAKPKPKITVPICGANYVKPREKRPVKQFRTIKEGAGQTPEQKMPSVPSSMEIGSSSILEALRLTQKNMETLQNIQLQTAQLHQQFLANQDAAVNSFANLIAQQQQVLNQSMGIPVSMPVQNIPVQQIVVPQVQPAVVNEPLKSVEAFSEVVTAPAVTQGVDASFVSDTVLELVSEKTGYPVEMLEMQMNLDSDLGIDSIKRVEIFSGLVDRIPGVKAVRPDQMGTIKTLKDIVDYIGEAAPTSSTGMTVATTQVSVSTSAGTEEAKDILLEIVSEKTGYPVEMLEMEMNLDSDLGIDSIKRVEIFSALKDKLPGMSVVKPDQMGTLKTLSDIVSFMAKSSPVTESTVQTTKNTASGVDESKASGILLDIVAEKTGYPVEMLEPEMNLDSDLGIDSIKRVEIFSALKDKIPVVPVVKPEQMGTLKTLSDIIGFITASSGEPAPAASIMSKKNEILTVKQENNETVNVDNLKRLVLSYKKIDRNQNREKLTLSAGSEIWITKDDSGLAEAVESVLKHRNFSVKTISPDNIDNLEVPQLLSGLFIISPEKNINDSFIKNSFRLLQKAASSLREAGGKNGAVFATISRMDGYSGLKNMNPEIKALSGGLAGLSKTAGHEWPEVSCKSLDIEKGLKIDHKTAAEIIDEIFTKTPVETGISKDGFYTTELVYSTVESDPEKHPVNEGDVVVITGGARGVTAECALRLAEGISGKHKPVLVLLGRSPEPVPEPVWLQSLEDESSIKREIMTQMGKNATPKAVSEQYNKHMSNREMLRTLARIESSGTKALYRSVDVRNRESLTQVIDEIRKTCGNIRGIIHGAGVLADKFITDKTPEEFDRVYGTKVEGLRNLLAATENDELSVIVLFSSSTGRFGRKGQVDYAVANEVLNKIAQQQAEQRPTCRVVSVNWGPWDGGMVTPSLKKLFESEGIGVIPLKDGAEYLFRELSSVDRPVEVVVMGKLPGETKPEPPSGKLKDLSICFEREISIDDYPFLKSHVIGGKAVLPAAVMMEWLAHGAMQVNAGLQYHGFNNFRVFKGLKVEQGETGSFRVLAGRSEKSGSLYVVPVELRSTTGEGSDILNARAEVVLADRLPVGKSVLAGFLPPPFRSSNGEIYSDMLFHGPDFQGINKINGYSDDGITGSARQTPPISEWIRNPLRSKWITDPLILDCSFQMMIIWSFEKMGAGSLPSFIGSYRQFGKFGDSADVRIKVTGFTENRANADIEFLDDKGNLVGRIENFECTIDKSLKKAFDNNKLEMLVV
jgi:acyl transferase domain-containing protein/acyl carrier protein/NAD(P)-dependent dehydrogenase (short-subunit alcohol dehydrogenase family)